MRIAISKPRKGAGGGTTMALTIAQGLRDRGHDVFLLAHPRSHLRLRARELGFDVAPVLIGRDAPRLAWLWSWQALLRRRPDVLLAFVARENDIDFAVPPALRLGIPIVARRGLTGVTLDERRRRLFEQVQWVGVSRAIARELRDAVPAAPAPIVIPNGTDLQHMHDTSPARLDLPVGALAVGFVARLHREKGIEELGVAWPRIAQAVPNAHLLIAGAGEHEHVLRTALADSPRVHWLGFRRDAPALMKALDLLVLPTHHEGFPNAIVEAMAAGLPVVSTTVDGPIEAVDDGLTGTLVPPGDAARLGEAVITLLQDQGTRERMSAAALESARQRFDVNRMIEAYEQVLLQRVG
ncbi:MAG TPA: glycosyltransferase family 4 protein [Longimicrobiales bacterium]|nr:glycosyltransferase family 4 protein [Longimicrobiales bacterium]